MELRLNFVNSISYALVLAIIPLSKANYDAQLAFKVKELDMEYGVRLTSLEEARMNDIEDTPASEAAETTVTTPGTSTLSTRCTTEKPLPKLSANFFPNEIGGKGAPKKPNGDKGDGGGKKVPKGKYLAPSAEAIPNHYIDDE